MKGLRKYIAKHGRHFTPELAAKVLDCKWNASEVEIASDRVVYYNVSGATLGDIVFLPISFPVVYLRGDALNMP